MVETLLIPYYFNGQRLSGIVVATLDNLTERTFTKCVDNLVAVGQVVMRNHQVVTSFVIIAKVVRGYIWRRSLFLAFRANMINLRVIQNFLTLIVRQVLALTAFEDSYACPFRYDASPKKKTGKTYQQGMKGCPVVKARGNEVVRPAALVWNHWPTSWLVVFLCRASSLRRLAFLHHQ